MSWTTIPDITAGELTVAEMNAIINNLRSANPVGKYVYLLRAATTSETLVEGCWLECNGVSVLRATYPDLNTLLSGLSYPFGSADGTHMTLPDIQGRDLVAMSSGGHADVNALGDSDGVTKANRTPKHNSTNSLTLPNHVHPEETLALYAQGANNVQGGTSTGISTTPGHNTGNPTSLPAIGGTIGPGGTRPIDTSTYLVGGCWFVKAIT